MYASNKMKNKILEETIARKESEDEEVVITGMAGKFPESDDIYQLRENLYNKEELITDDDRRWKPTNPDIPQCTGKLNDISAFDAGFFGISSRYANNMDFSLRMILEKTYEVIVDAGYHPSELVGTKTGVFTGICSSDSECYILSHKKDVNSNGITGSTRSMIAQHISYFFRLQGPSYTIDSACSSSMYSLEHAYRSIKEGVCDMAIVAGLNQCLNPNISLSFARLGVLTFDEHCRPFDNNADGYIRSEAITALFLQKSKSARRIYAHILHSKLNSDGYKEQGITHPSGQIQTDLMKKVYSECNVNLSDVSFLEAHATGTQVGDLQELNAIANVFCSQRKKPLYIGSVKSNMGHTESAASSTSIIKVLIGMENGFIPPNVNYSEPRHDVDALIKGQLKVITEKTPWPQGKVIAGVNSIGAGGSNGHVVFHWNEKEKRNLGLPEDDLPRLVCASGRTNHSLNIIWNDLKNRSLDSEFIGLFHTIFEKSTSNHPYRGYQILTKVEGEIQRSVKRATGDEKLALIFSNFKPSWHRIGKKLMAFPRFMEALETIQSKMIELMNIDVINLLETFGQETVTNQIFATMTTQLCLASMLNSVGLIPSKLIGLGTGTLITAYLNGHLNLSELIYAHLFIAVKFYDGINTSLMSDEYLRDLGKSILNLIPLDRKERRILCSLNYFAETFRFEDAQELLPNDYDVSVIGPPIKNLSSLIRDDSQDCVLDLLTALGRFYENGYDLRLGNLYPKITWPVSRGTPMISPLIKWDHKEDWYVASYNNTERVSCKERTVHINIKSNEWSFISGHVIDGKNLFPATGYLFLVWETLAEVKGKSIAQMKIIFEHVKFIQAISLTNKDDVELLINVSTGNRMFEISERGSLLVKGTAYEVLCTQQESANLSEHNVEYVEEKITLEQAEVYRKLRLKGYDYKGGFKAIKCEIGEQNVSIKWAGNWITFLDSMVQTVILHADNRKLYLPTSIEYLLIDPITHLEKVGKRKESETLVTVHIYYDLGIIRSPGIEFRRIKTDAVSRKKDRDPILETYKFIANNTALTLDESVRVMAQIIVENNRLAKFRSVEVAEELELISPYLKQALDDLISSQTETTVLSKQSLDIPGISFQNRSTIVENDLLLVILSRALEKSESLRVALKSVKRNKGYVLSREILNFDVSTNVPDYLDILCVHTTDLETLLLLRMSAENKEPVVIKLTDDLTWISTVKDSLKLDQKIIIYSQNSLTSGILGLVNCLRKETKGECFSCFFIMDDAPEFDIKHPFFKKQYTKNMVINVWKDGRWGTYRHLSMKQNFKVECRNSYAKVVTPGDLSSIQFIEGNPYKTSDFDSDNKIILVYWASLNFRDVVTASGRISGDSSNRNFGDAESVLGLEFSGRDINGKRIMGFSMIGTLATHVKTDLSTSWAVPTEWTLEDAATVPCVYLTVIYALLMKANIKQSQSVLIHSAAGGVGQAAINIALHFDCNIFLTVGTQEKRDFLRNKYPQIKQTQIGNSRDTSFEHMVLWQTQGRGVDIILNSLSEDKLLASVRCLAQNGKFLEIGKFDIEQDSNLDLRLFDKNISFHGVMLDVLYSHMGKTELKQQVSRYFADLLCKGVIKPLPRTIFKKEEIAGAFKLMASGKHIGKVLVNIRKEEEMGIFSVQDEVIEGLPRYHCHAKGIYIIIGGLGGFGLELADWLIQRGARKLILSSRTGLKTGYQAMMLRIWKSRGAHISVRTDNVTTEEGCNDLITYAQTLGPVKAVFNVAVVLNDGAFEDQTVETFKISLAPKALTTQNLDVVTRVMCPLLSEFVVFSSVICGRGNAEQSNYGMSNSVMERICEERQADGFPALAIQWGGIADLGLLAHVQENIDSEITIAGCALQKISSCLQVLDIFLRQKEPIVSSTIIDRKCNISGNDILLVALNILGITNLDKINHHSTFSELGMDSIINGEIKQILERELELFLTSQDLRAMTVAKLQDLINAKTAKQTLGSNLKTEGEIPESLQLLFALGGEEISPNEPVVRMGDSMKDNAVQIFVLPGMEGTVSAMKTLVQNMDVNAVCMQYTEETIQNTVEQLSETILQYMDVKANTFILLAHSFGCVVAIHLAYLLEKSGRYGKLILIDGAPNLVKVMKRELAMTESEDDLETNIVCIFMALYFPTHIILKNKHEMSKCTTLEDRVRLCLNVVSKSHTSYECLFKFFLTCCRRVKAHFDYDPKFPKLKSRVKLIKPKEILASGLAEDYGLSNFFENVEKVEEFEGGHRSILNNPKVALAINEFIQDGIHLNK